MRPHILGRNVFASQVVSEICICLGFDRVSAARAFVNVSALKKSVLNQKPELFIHTV